LFDDPPRLIYKCHALLLVFTVVKGKKGHLSEETHVGLVKKLQTTVGCERTWAGIFRHFAPHCHQPAETGNIPREEYPDQMALSCMGSKLPAKDPVEVISTCDCPALQTGMIG
jgi:hypothetical protein